MQDSRAPVCEHGQAWKQSLTGRTSITVKRELHAIPSCFCRVVSGLVSRESHDLRRVGKSTNLYRRNRSPVNLPRWKRNERNKSIAAILTIATSARESRGTSEEIGKEKWRRVIQHYHQILAELEHDSASAK
jgi:hypothetical protein